VSIVQRARERVRALRSRSPVVDHAVRTVDRQGEVLGGQLAAAITYYGFLSFFPLLALAFSLVGYVSDAFPDAQEHVTAAVEDAFPSLIGTGPGQLDIQDVIDARVSAGIIGLLGLAYAGLGWLDAVRDALRRVFGVDGARPNLVRRKLVDVVVLSMLGASLLVSIVVSSLATAGTTYALAFASLDGSVFATGVLKAVSVALALAVDFAIVAILLSRLSGAHPSWRRVRSGALLGAAGFEVLKLLGTYLIGHTADNPVYATFGVVVGLLVWMNLVSQLLVVTACWAATQPYSLEPARIGEPGVGRTSGLAWTTEPVAAVAPGDYDALPAADELGSPSSRRGSWRGVLVGAGAGAAAAALVTRRRSARSRG